MNMDSSTPNLQGQMAQFLNWLTTLDLENPTYHPTVRADTAIPATDPSNQESEIHPPPQPVMAAESSIIPTTQPAVPLGPLLSLPPEILDNLLEERVKKGFTITAKTHKIFFAQVVTPLLRTENTVIARTAVDIYYRTNMFRIETPMNSTHSARDIVFPQFANRIHNVELLITIDNREGASGKLLAFMAPNFVDKGRNGDREMETVWHYLFQAKGWTYPYVEENENDVEDLTNSWDMRELSTWYNKFAKLRDLKIVVHIKCGCVASIVVTVEDRTGATAYTRSSLELLFSH
jgi:hypothetical protein